jgi:hypothetical protein
MAKRVIPEVAEAFGADPDELAEQMAAAPPPVVASPHPVASVAAPVVIAAQPITMTFEQLQALMSTQAASSQQNTQALADALTQGIKQAQPQRPSNEIAPDISDANPLGERDHPRPGLKCKVTLGIMDGKNKQIQPTYPFVAEDLTVYEQIALNTLAEGEYVIKLYDGKDITVQVIEQRDDLKRLQRIVIVVPQQVTLKGSETRNMLPGPVNIVAQITGRDFSKLSLEDLEWFMAEHRAKRYVSERPASVAA